ncbi:protocadherin beta-15-like [Argonauta hians]
MTSQNPIFIVIFLLTVRQCKLIDLTYSVKEEESRGTYIGDIAADSHLFDTMPIEDSRMITFSEVQWRSTQLFNVSGNGKLYTAQKLDAESLCIFNKECSRISKVAIRKGKSFLKILKVKIIIEDVNDHQPKFPNSHVSIQFSERDSKGSQLTIPNAIDKDVYSKNHMISYKLKTNDAEPFSLSVTKRADGISTLKIILEKKLDREEKDTYNIEIVAKDGGSPAKQSSLYVEVVVKDENDNQPIFSQSIYNISIEVTHTLDRPVVKLIANDLDIGDNGVVSYYFSPMNSNNMKSKFHLDQHTGELFLTKQSHVEEKNYFELYIEARDGGNPPLSSIATLVVNVINQHNNPPVIDINFVSAINENTATISEDIKVGSFISYVMVTDNDIGHNGQVKCHIKDDTFKLQSMGSKEYKIVLKKAVDRETQEHYHFTVSCEDKGLPALKTDKDLSIQVLDVNDVKPHFTKDTFKFLTYENDKANFPIGFINATDPDIGKGGELSYYLRNKQDYRLPFQIINSGFISTNQSLDRELRDLYVFEVFVKDNGTPSLNNTVNVEVEVLDRNDNAPYFTFPNVDPFTLDVHYHPQSKHAIIILKAFDIDSHMNAFLRYEIMSGNERQLFKLDSFMGVLSYSRTVYQNDAGSYHLKFVVKDSGTPVLTATTSIYLTLTVSNKTSQMFPAVQLPSDKTTDTTLLIIIVVAAVVVSIAIVVSITLCFVRGSVRNSSSRRTEEKQTYLCHSEMRQLIYQGNNSVSMMSGNQGQITDRYKHSGNQYCPDDWNTHTVQRMPKTLNKYSEPAEVIYDELRELENYKGDALVTYKEDNSRSWIDRDMGYYEEIPALTDIYNTRPSMTASFERHNYQERDLKPHDKQLSLTQADIN